MGGARVPRKSKKGLVFVYLSTTLGGDGFVVRGYVYLACAVCLFNPMNILLSSPISFSLIHLWCLCWLALKLGLQYFHRRTGMNRVPPLQEGKGEPTSPKPTLNQHRISILVPIFVLFLLGLDACVFLLFLNHGMINRNHGEESHQLPQIKP